MSSTETLTEARERVLRCLDVALFGRTDAQAARQWTRGVEAVDALVATARAERDGAIVNEPTRVGWRRWAWVDGDGRLSIMKANATREEVAELGEPDERLIRVQITEIDSGNQVSPEHSATTRRSAAQK